jgi:hypothetical protein
MTNELYEMTIEELFNYYYFSRANMERSVKCHASESVIASYAIVINNIINEVKNRIDSSVDSYTGENVVVYDGEIIC